MGLVLGQDDEAVGHTRPGDSDIQGYRRYLRTLFVVSINGKIASQLQSYAPVYTKHANLINTMAPDHDCSRGVVTGMMQQAPPKSLRNAVTTPRMFALDPSTRDSLASSMVAAGTAGARAETSPPLAGGYRQGGVGGGNGGRTPIKKSGGCQECGHHKGGWSQIHPGPLFG